MTNRSADSIEEEPCRHCGTPTTQRAEGIPYCSMDCIGGRRRDLRMESYECPYPDCNWSAEYDPESRFSKMTFRFDVQEHREKHEEVER